MIGLADEQKAPWGGNDRLPLILFTVSVAVQLVVSQVMPITLTEDSPGYIQLAGNLGNSATAPQRTLGYPVLLYLFGVDWTGSVVPAVIAQQIMACLMPVLVYLTCCRASRRLAFLAGLATTGYLYFHALAVIIMTDLTFPFFILCACYTVVAYSADSRWYWLLATLGVIFVVAEIRPNGGAAYVALGTIIALQLVMNNRRKAGYRYHAYLALVVMVGGLHLVGKGYITERTSTHMMPFFVWHWAYDDTLWRKAPSSPYNSGASSGLNDHFVVLENGKWTREFFGAFKEALAKDRIFARRFLSEIDERGSVLGIKSHYKDIALTDTDAIMHVVLNDRNYHNGPNMIFGMWRLLGKKRTTSLLRGALLEAFITRPDVLWERFRYAVGKLQTRAFYLRYMIGQWVHVPTPDTFQNSGPYLPISTDILAEWIYGTDDKTGRGERQGVIWQTSRFDEAVTALKEDDNLIAFGKYVLGVSTTYLHLAAIWLTVLTLVFVRWSSHRIGWLFTFMMGAVFPTVAFFLSELDFKQLMAGFPMMAIALVFAFEGMFRLATIGLVRARRPGPKIA